MPSEASKDSPGTTRSDGCTCSPCSECKTRKARRYIAASRVALLLVYAAVAIILSHTVSTDRLSAVSNTMLLGIVITLFGGQFWQALIATKEGEDLMGQKIRDEAASTGNKVD